LASAILMLGGIAAAEEIVHFTNGNTMAVRSHRIDNGMIHVDLGSNGFMAFPEQLVERIEAADQKVHLQKSTVSPDSSAPMIADSGSVSGAPIPPSGQSVDVNGRSEVQVTPGVERDQNGVAYRRPLAGSRSASKRQIRVNAGTQSYGPPGVRTNAGQGGRPGTRAQGGRQVINPPGMERVKPPVTTLRRREAPAQPKPESSDSGDSDQ